jgi:hypothetical protein
MYDRSRGEGAFIAPNSRYTPLEIRMPSAKDLLYEVFARIRSWQSERDDPINLIYLAESEHAYLMIEDVRGVDSTIPVMQGEFLGPIAEF